MMFEYTFKLTGESDLIKKAVDASLAEGVVTVDIAGQEKSYSTSEVGDWLTEYILAQN
jgi:3-isopropylmalate dehydrogenase